MEQHELRLYTVDMKYIRNLQNKDSRFIEIIHFLTIYHFFASTAIHGFEL